MSSTPSDGGFRDHLRKLREDREEREAARRKMARSVISATEKQEWEQRQHERDADVFRDAINASREFAKLATIAGIPTNEVNIYRGEEKLFLRTRDVYENRQGWMISTGGDSEYVDYKSPDSHERGFWTSSHSGLYVLRDGSCLMGSPSRLTPILTPEEYLAKALSNDWWWSRSYWAQYGELIRNTPLKLAEFLHRAEIGRPT